MKRLSSSPVRGLAALALLLVLTPAAAGNTADPGPGAVPTGFRVIPLATPAREAVIETVIICEMGENDAIIAWTTTAPASEEVSYSCLNQAPVLRLSLAADTQHRLTLANLLRGTEYRFTIHGVANHYGAFTTPGVPPPLFQTIGVTAGDPHQVRIEWTTNQATRYQLGVRAEGEELFRVVAADNGMDTRHAVVLPRLTPQTRYDYLIEATDAAGYTVNTGTRSFATGEQNVAWRRPARGTFDRTSADANVEPATDPQARITDGDDAYFTGMALSGDPADTDQWAEIDLGRNWAVSEVRTVWRTLAYPRAFALYGSTDGRRWELIADRLDARTGAAGRSRRGDPILTLATPAADRSYRYVKVVVPAGSPYSVKHADWDYVQLMELKVLSRE